MAFVLVETLVVIRSDHRFHFDGHMVTQIEAYTYTTAVRIRFETIYIYESICTLAPPDKKRKGRRRRLCFPENHVESHAALFQPERNL